MKDSLKDIVRERTRFIVYDCNSLIALRSKQTQEIIGGRYGGGNFLMAIGLFSAINFLAKIYMHLLKSDVFITQEEVDAVKAAKKELIKSSSISQDIKNILRASKTNWIEPHLGSVNEVESFVFMVHSLNTSKRRNCPDFGIKTDDEARMIWKTYRNALAHMVMPLSPIGTIGEINAGTFNEVLFVIKNGPKSFFLQENRWVCNADKLTVDVYDLAEWICKEIDDQPDESVYDALKWVEA